MKLFRNKTVGQTEKDLGLPKDSIRNADGSNARSDKKIGTLLAELGRSAFNLITGRGKSQ
jgi:hypothetical protein